MPRNVQVTVSAEISGFVANMSRAAAATKNLGSTLTTTLGKNSDSVSKLSTVALGLGGAIALGVGAAVKSSADFDRAMSNVAATGSDARRNIDQLRDAAIDLGASTSFSASEAAQGIENLAKAGVSAQDTLGGGLKGALDLAAAGGLGVGEAAEAAASAMSQFGLRGKDVTHIADLLAQGAGTASGEVSDMAQALKQSGLVANQFGLSVDETVQSLALFAKNGLLGSDAGTSFKTMLTSLYAPSGAAAKTLDKLGVSAYDAQGALKPIGVVADELKGKLDGLSAGDRNQALKNIFGSDAIRAGTILLRDGSAGLAQMATEFGKFGTAAQVAATKQDNLYGDIEKLGGAVDSLLIKFGESGQGGLRQFTQGVTGLVDGVSELPDGLKTAGLSIAAISGFALLGVGGLGKLVVAANETKTAMTALGIGAKQAGIAAGGIGGGLAIAAGAITYFATKSAESKARVDDLTQALIQSKGAIDGTIASSRAKALEDSGALRAAQRLGISISDVTQASLGNADAQARVTAQMKIAAAQGRASIVTTGQAGQAQNLYATELKAVSDAVGGGNAELNRANDAYKRQAASAAAAAAANPKLADAVTDTTGSLQDQTDTFQDLIDKTYAYANALLAVSGGQIGMEAAIDATAAALKENGKTLDINSEKGRANQTALNALAQATQSNVTEMLKAGASVNDVAAANDRGRNAWIRNSVAMGKNEKTARQTAEALFALPESVTSQVVVAGAKVSKKEAKDLNDALEGLPPETRTLIKTIAETKGAKAAKQAIAEVKDKTVIARSKGDIRGAKQVDSVMKALKDRYLKAVSRGDTRGARLIDAAMKALRDRTVTARTKADTSGARAAAAAVAAVRDRTVTIRTINVQSVKKESRAGGGFISGPGTSISDSIDARLSNGEFVVRAAAVRHIGVSRLHALNALGGPQRAFAGGGYVGVGATGYAAGGSVDIPALFALIRALQNPVGDLRRASENVSTAQQAANRANRVAAPQAAVVRRETAQYNAAVDRRDNLRDRVVRLRREAAATKGVTAADRELRRAQIQLSAANNTVSKASREKTAAQQAYTKAAAPAKAATDRLKAAQAALAEQQKQLADSARTVSDQFGGMYRSTSTDAADWIALMNTGATDIAAFTAQIQRLRKAGLSETLVQQIIGMGASAGSEIAAQIAAGGAGLVKQLNNANAALQTAADNLGYNAATGAGRYAGGGFVTGPGSSTSDSIDAKLSDGEYVVNAAATAANRNVLDRINYGRTVVERPVFAQAYAGGGYVNTAQSPSIDAAALRQALGGIRMTGELVMRDGKAYVEAITLGVLRQQGRQLSRTA